MRGSTWLDAPSYQPDPRSGGGQWRVSLADSSVACNARASARPAPSPCCHIAVVRLVGEGSTPAAATTIALILGPLVQVFDTATVSIALRHMQGELSATQDQIAWVITSYLITLTVFTPVWGVLGGMFGRKRLILISIAGFTSSAMMSGMSTSLTEILIWRAVQGFFGSALLPLGMSFFGGKSGQPSLPLHEFRDDDARVLRQFGERGA